jgi:hypothetical protein
MGKKSVCWVIVGALGLLAAPLVTHAQVQNLLQNPSFEEDEVILNDPANEKWWTWGWEAGLQGTCEVVETECVDGLKSLRIVPKGGTSWYFIVANSPIPMEVGKRYTASFWIKADAPRPVSAKMKATDNSIDWNETLFEVTTEWAEYHWTSEAKNAAVKIEFHCAAVDTPFWLDFVNVYEGEYVAGVDPSGLASPGKAARPEPGNGLVVDKTQVVLKWKAGKFAVLHEVYFGESFEEVSAATPDNTNVFVGRQPTILLPVGMPGGPRPEGLVPGKTYYWRVDEINDADPESPWKGDVWSFMVQPLIAWKPYPADGMKYVDPNQDLKWQKGAGNVLFHMVYFGDNLDKVQNAAAGGWMSVNPTYDPGTLQLDKTYYWRVDEFLGATTRRGDIWSFATRGAGGGAKARYFKGMDLSGEPVLTRTEGSINHNWAGEIVAGLADGVSARWTANLEVPFTETYKLITTSDDGVRLWFDGRLVIDNWTDHGTADNMASVNLVAGQVYSIRMEWYENTGGAVAQLSWESPSLPRQIIPQGWLQLPLRAAGPSPANAAPHAVQNAVLQWLAGEQATNHDVYFGDSADAVASADTTTAGIYQGRQTLEQTTFDPGPLEWGKTYYWRVDEINTADAGSPWKGAVWSFTTADFIVVDDFESYTDEEGSEIFQTWIDGWTNNNGSRVGYLQPPYAEQKVVNGGFQSMPLDYNNVVTPFYSETERTWDTPQNWTDHDMSALTLFVHGKRSNGADKLYVGLEDKAGKVGVAVHPDAGVTQSTTWVRWDIPFSDFSGVNPAAIKKMYIGVGDRKTPTPGGTGLLFIDDIRATKP